jgi:antirestriction protein ArdC
MATSTRHALTDEQREERRTQQRKLITASIEQLRSSDGWRAYLKTRAAFRSYSPRNLLLILCQRPSATQVAGFRAWLKLGYCVRRGERAIRIWAPCPPSKKQLQAWRDAGADPVGRPRTHWRLASVFAQDQVAELPPPAVPAPLAPPAMVQIAGDSHAEYLGRLTGLIGDLGYRVQFSDTGQAEGIHRGKQKLIEISDRLDANGQLAAGIHETAHALVALDELAPELSYAEEELVAESIAYCTCQTIGLRTDENSIPYLTSWAQQADLAVLERAAALTSRLADRIEAALLDDDNVGVDDEHRAAQATAAAGPRGNDGTPCGRANPPVNPAPAPRSGGCMT